MKGRCLTGEEALDGMKDAQSGKNDRDEIERLYNMYGARLLAYTCSIVVDRATAEDVLHHVFVKLLSGDVRIPETPQPYLYRAVRNAALNTRRHAARVTELDAERLWFEAPPGRTEDVIALQRTLMELSEEQREVVMLRIWGQMTLEEAAAVTGVPLNTAASRYRYGLAKLRERLRPNDTE